MKNQHTDNTLQTLPSGGWSAKKYQTPHIELIPLDSEISLVLESPPSGPDETYNYNQQNPFIEGQLYF